MPEAPKANSNGGDYSLSEKNKTTLQFIEDVTENADQVQKRVLSEILSRSAGVEYLNRHGLSGQTDRDSFKKLVPVIKYEDIQSDISRIANGDMSSILCSQPISEFLTRYKHIHIHTCIMSCKSLNFSHLLTWLSVKKKIRVII